MPRRRAPRQAGARAPPRRPAPHRTAPRTAPPRQAPVAAPAAPAAAPAATAPDAAAGNDAALASDANLRLLYVPGREAALLLLTAARLRALSPALAMDAPLAGAVVGRSDFAGALALRRVVRVLSIELMPEGAPLAQAWAARRARPVARARRLQLLQGGARQPPAHRRIGAAAPTTLQPPTPNHHSPLPPAGGLNRAATLLELAPCEPRPVPLLALDERPAPTVPVWRDAVRAFHQGWAATAGAAAAASEEAAGEQPEAAGGGGPSSGVLLGGRAECGLVALQLAQLLALAPLLAELSASVAVAGGAALEDAAWLAAGGGGYLSPDARAKMVALLRQVCAARCEGPPPDALRALGKAVQGREAAAAAWRAEAARERASAGAGSPQAGAEAAGPGAIVGGADDSGGAASAGGGAAGRQRKRSAGAGLGGVKKKPALRSPAALKVVIMSDALAADQTPSANPPLAGKGAAEQQEQPAPAPEDKEKEQQRQQQQQQQQQQQAQQQQAQQQQVQQQQAQRQDQAAPPPPWHQPAAAPPPLELPSQPQQAEAAPQAAASDGVAAAVGPLPPEERQQLRQEGLRQWKEQKQRVAACTDELWAELEALEAAAARHAEAEAEDEEDAAGDAAQLAAMKEGLQQLEEELRGCNAAAAPEDATARTEQEERQRRRLSEVAQLQAFIAEFEAGLSEGARQPAAASAAGASSTDAAAGAARAAALRDELRALEAAEAEAKAAQVGVHADKEAGGQAEEQPQLEDEDEEWSAEFIELGAVGIPAAPQEAPKGQQEQQEQEQRQAWKGQPQLLQMLEDLHQGRQQRQAQAQAREEEDDDEAAAALRGLLASPGAAETPASRRRRSAWGSGGGDGSGGSGGSGGEAPPSPSRRDHSPRRGGSGRGSGSAGGGGGEAPARSITTWVDGPAGGAALLKRTPADDVRLWRRGFPESVDSPQARVEFTELLLALGAVYAVSAAGVVRDPRTRFNPGDREFERLGPATAVDLLVLWRQLPAVVRAFVEREGGGGAAAAAAARDARDARVDALAAFVSRRCAALRLVEPAPRRPRSAALAPGWRDALLGHELLRAAAPVAQAEVLEALGPNGEADVSYLKDLVYAPEAKLYLMVGGLGRGPPLRPCCWPRASRAGPGRSRGRGHGRLAAAPLTLRRAPTRPPRSPCAAPPPAPALLLPSVRGVRQL
jgi:hypothetical protein